MSVRRPYRGRRVRGACYDRAPQLRIFPTIVSLGSRLRLATRVHLRSIAAWVVRAPRPLECTLTTGVDELKV